MIPWSRGESFLKDKHDFAATGHDTRRATVPRRHPTTTMFVVMKRIIGIALAALLAACSEDPVKWIVARGAGIPNEPQQMKAGAVVPGASPCTAFARTASMGNASFTAWWDVRADSSAVLFVARSGAAPGTWGDPIAVDTTDHSRRGCGRPPPSISADSASGYVYVAYFAEPAQGPGIFFVHSMDGGASFHAPFPVVFGRNPARVSVAAKGNRVVVAYEDPNSLQPRIGLALSRTEGHLFEERSVASGDNARAKQPVAALAGDTIRVWWSEYSANPTVSATRPGYREGVWR